MNTSSPEPEWIWFPEIDSTQEYLLGERQHNPQAAAWPHGTVVATDHQTAGRGRRGNTWSSPRGTSVAISVLISSDETGPGVHPSQFSWLTLVAAAGLTEWFRGLGVSASVKWPNDVMGPDQRKLVGILSSYEPQTQSLILGVGINRDFSATGPPVPHAASLAEYGIRESGQDAQEFARLATSHMLGAIHDFVETWSSAGQAEAIRPVERLMHTLGQHIRGELPGGRVLVGEAVGLGEGGALLVLPAAGADLSGLQQTADGLVEVSAGVIKHVRPVRGAGTE